MQPREVFAQDDLRKATDTRGRGGGGFLRLLEKAHIHLAIAHSEAGVSEDGMPADFLHADTLRQVAKAPRRDRRLLPFRRGEIPRAAAHIALLSLRADGREIARGGDGLAFLIHYFHARLEMRGQAAGRPVCGS